MGDTSKADFIALIAILVAVISAGLNLHLMADNNRYQADIKQLKTEYHGFKDGCVYGR